MARELFGRLLPYGKMPQTLLIGGFAGVILVGALSLPRALHRDMRSVRRFASNLLRLLWAL